MGLTAAEAVVVSVDPEVAFGVVCEVAGLEAKGVWRSLAAGERTERGREGGAGGVEKMLVELGGALGLSFSHVGPSLEEASLLVLLGSCRGAGFGVFVGKSRRGAHLLAGVSDLTNQKWF